MVQSHRPKNIHPPTWISRPFSNPADDLSWHSDYFRDFGLSRNYGRDFCPCIIYHELHPLHRRRHGFHISLLGGLVSPNIFRLIFLLICRSYYFFE